MKINLTNLKCTCCKNPFRGDSIYTDTTSPSGLAHHCGCGQVDNIPKKNVKGGPK